MSGRQDIVAIDGPAGAGKSTVARRVAQALGFAYLDTGATYRAATWWAMHRGVDLNDATALAEATRAMQYEVAESGGALTVRVNGTNVTDEIRTPEVTRNISKLDNRPAVREVLVDLQRRLAANAPTVAEGRDMGTVVFPNARCKIYLDASLDERTRRRAQDFAAKGIAINPDDLRNDIHARDERDKSREHSPLKCAPGAQVIDTSGMSPDEVVEAIVNIVRKAWS